MSPPIYTPDGSEVSEIVLPDGSTASQVIGPDGNVVFEAGGDIPDSEADHQWEFTAGSGTTVKDVNGTLDASFTGINWQSGAGAGDVYALLDGTDDRGDLGTESRSVFSSWVRSGEGAFSVWARIDDFAVDLQTFFASNSGAENAEFWYRSSSQVSIRVGNSSSNVNIIDLRNISISGEVSEGQWANFAVTSDGSTARIVVNGTELGSATVQSNNTVASDFANNINLGGQANEDRYLGGGYGLAFFSPTHIPVSDIQTWVNDTEKYYP